MDSGRLEAAPSGAVHLDTVRALHQTVVSLRTALEVSKNELKQLKDKYEQHSHCLEYADVIEKLTVENHILRRKIIDSGVDNKEISIDNLPLEVTYTPRSQHNEELTSSDALIVTTTDKNTLINELEPISIQSDDNSNWCSAEKLNDIQEISESPPILNISNNSTPPDVSNNNTEVEELSGITSAQTETEAKEEKKYTNFKTKLELLSKFDVRIKVKTIKEGCNFSSTTSESDSSDIKKDFVINTGDIKKGTNLQDSSDIEKHISKIVNLESISTENVKMAVPNEGDVKSKTDKFDVQVRITSEENLTVKENIERSRRKDTLNLDVDDLSLRSMSEGDNSVFSETTTPADPNAVPVADEKQDDNASGNESEEVDDIELIFTTDESKDMSNLQEDLVSIQETDQWVPQSASTTHSTPVLVKFHTLDLDFQPDVETKQMVSNAKSQENTIQVSDALKQKRVSLPNDKEIRHVAFNGKGNLELPSRSILKSFDNKSDNMLYKKSTNASSRRLDSVDSLTGEYNRGLSLDNTKSSSFELGSSIDDILHRDESVDSFYKNKRMGHRYSVFADTDISKCGTSEEDLAFNLNIRRNTCPNPFQYRPMAYRGVSRPPGPFKAGASRLRPVLRDPVHARRESGAQTDVCALPNRWSSDGYLAHKLPVPSGGLLPAGPARGGLRPPPSVPAAPPATVDSRRVMLSDIGFTSMVPELSRSADPVWALGKLQSQGDDSAATSTSKFLSRGSSYRSPCLSIDRSNDWTSQHGYLTSKACSAQRAWRSSLPDVRRDDTVELLAEAELFVRRSIDNLHASHADLEKCERVAMLGQPYIPAEPRHLRLGHTVKLITPHGRIALGRVRYVGLAGGSAANSSVVIGAEFLHTQQPGLPRNDGTYRGRRYFLTPPQHTALFVPFSKVVMAWTN